MADERRAGERRQTERRKPWGMTPKEAWALAREMEELHLGEATPHPCEDLQGGYRVSLRYKGDGRTGSDSVSTLEEAIAFAARNGIYPEGRGDTTP